MAKDKITEYDATANNNTVCGDVNIAENSALPSDMNNFAREIMSHLKEGLGSGTPLYVDQTNNRVGINKTPTVALDVSGDANLSGTLDVTGTVTAGGLTVEQSGNDVSVQFNNTNNDFTTATSSALRLSTTASDNNLYYGEIKVQENSADTSSTNMLFYPKVNQLAMKLNNNGDISFYEDTGTTPKLFWDASEERLGIGTTSPQRPLHVDGLEGVARFTSTASGNNGFEVGIGTSSQAFLWQSENSYMQFATNAAERMRIDSSGNVGIGTSSPSSFTAENDSKLVVGTGGGNSAITIYTGTASRGGLFFADGTSGAATYAGILRYDHSDNAMLFYTNGLNERMRIDSSGNVLIDTTTANGIGATFNTQSGGVLLIFNTDYSGGFTAQQFRYNGTAVGGIVINTSSTSFNTSSDHRLKENVTSDWDATTRLKQLNPVRFNFIADADTTVDGFLAHEVQSVVPEAITGTHNEVDDDGNPVYQGIDQSKLVPLLVKTIQELEARIVALETA